MSLKTREKQVKILLPAVANNTQWSTLSMLT